MYTCNITTIITTHAPNKLLRDKNDVNPITLGWLHLDLTLGYLKCVVSTSWFAEAVATSSRTIL